MEGSDPRIADRERALASLGELREETMAAAWGPGRPREERRRIVLAALILGRKLEERLASSRTPPAPEEAQRFLMSIMNDTVTEFARQESLDQSAATEFLSDVGNRDLVLEFNEVLEAAGETGAPLDEQLRRIVEDRRERAIWSDHWSSG